MVCTLISNGYALTNEWVRRLNDAGLTLLQMSVDNIEPNEYSQKSWIEVRKKLELLKEHARFGVTINAVLGSSTLEQTREVVDAVARLGFYMTVGLMHDADGQIQPGLLRDDLAAVYDEMQRKSRKSMFHRAGEGWEADMLRDGSSPFKCRAGGRYLYVDEFGLVSYCSQRRGAPGIDLLDYTADDVRAGVLHAERVRGALHDRVRASRVGVRRVAVPGRCLTTAAPAPAHRVSAGVADGHQSRPRRRRERPGPPRRELPRRLHVPDRADARRGGARPLRCRVFHHGSAQQGGHARPGFEPSCRSSRARAAAATAEASPHVSPRALGAARSASLALLIAGLPLLAWLAAPRGFEVFTARRR